VACGDVIPTLNQVQSWSPPPAPPPDWSSFVNSVRTSSKPIKDVTKLWINAIDTYHQKGFPIRKGTEMTRAMIEAILVGKNP
jgi:hypothetical protein